ncbi:MAG: hypothetical protein LH617_07885 [Ramlibacter sp.]|nr:hypothetical protein [Ramlibacter sp.]
MKLFADEHHVTAAAALAIASQVAREQIDALPSLDCSLDCSTFGFDPPYFDSRSERAA